MSGELLPAGAAEVARPARVRLSTLAGPFLGLLLIIFLGGVAEYFLSKYQAYAHAIKEGQTGISFWDMPGTFNYWGVRNQCLILTQTATVAIGAVGMTIIIIAGGIDLAVGSVIALTAVVAAWVTNHYGGVGAGRLAGPPAVYLPLLAVLVAMSVGALVGGVNGVLITRLRLAPFIVTLGMMSFARGVAKWIAAEQKIDAPVSWIQSFTSANLKPLWWSARLGPWTLQVHLTPEVVFSSAVIATVMLAVGAAILLRRTRFGRHVFAIGSSEATARLCGVRVERMKVLIYLLAGLLFGLAGVTECGRTSVGDPTAAMGKELDIIAAVVIGGGSLSGGAGTILGSLIGALLMAHLRNLCVHLGLEQFWQEMVVGAVIVVAVAVDRFRQDRQRT